MRLIASIAATVGLLIAAEAAFAGSTVTLMQPAEGSSYYTGADGPQPGATADVPLQALFQNDGCKSGLWRIERRDPGENTGFASVTGAGIDTAQIAIADHLTFAGDYQYRARLDCVDPDSDDFISPVVTIHVLYGNGTPPVDPAACSDAQGALLKAKAKLQKLRASNASKSAIKKAKKKVKQRQADVDAACG